MRFRFFTFILLISMSSWVSAGEPPVLYCEIGSPKPHQTWVYLCGLSSDFNSDLEINNRAIMDSVGKAVGIAFIAVNPPARCPTADNSVCWPSEADTPLLNTYRHIKAVIKDRPVNGYLGFSNGAFFLNRLSQIQELKVPIISIAGAGVFRRSLKKKNTLYLLCSPADKLGYSAAKNFHKSSLGSTLSIEFIEYDGGHIIPKNSLVQLFRRLSSVF